MSVDPSVSCWFPHYRCPCSVRKIPLCPAGQHGLGHASLASPKLLQACLEGRKIRTFSTSANVRNGWGLTCVISKLWSQLSKRVVKFAAIQAQALLFEHKSEEVGLRTRLPGQGTAAMARCISCPGEVCWRGGRAGVPQKQGHPVVRSMPPDLMKWQPAPLSTRSPEGDFWASPSGRPPSVPCRSTPLCCFYYSLITWKLSVKLAQNHWSGVRNWDPPIFTHIVMPWAKVWVSDLKLLALGFLYALLQHNCRFDGLLLDSILAKDSKVVWLRKQHTARVEQGEKTHNVPSNCSPCCWADSTSPCHQLPLPSKGREGRKKYQHDENRPRQGHYTSVWCPKASSRDQEGARGDQAGDGHGLLTSLSQGPLLFTPWAWWLLPRHRRSAPTCVICKKEVVVWVVVQEGVPKVAWGMRWWEDWWDGPRSDAQTAHTYGQLPADG